MINRHRQEVANRARWANRARLIGWSWVAWLLMGCLAAGAQNPFASSQPGYPKWSPFDAVRWKADQPLVSIEGKWYTPISVHGISVEQILKHSDQQGWETKERFTEDLVQMIRLMGVSIDRETDLVLSDESGNEVRIFDFVMTARPPRYDPSLRRAELLEDLEFFEQSLRDRFAYVNTNAFDYSTRIRSIERRLGDETSVGQLASELELTMMEFIDGHARVSNVTRKTSKVLPFRLENTGTRVVAVLPDRSEFLHRDYPYLIGIDGETIDDWIKKTSPWIAKGSPQMLRQIGLGKLGSIDRYRERNIGEPIEVTLMAQDGTSTRKERIELVTRWESPGPVWPVPRKTGILESNIGYLRLPSMDGASVERIQEWMPRFRNTVGLIVDVRGNGGGSRTPLLELAGYLMDSSDAPRIGNVAKYRLARGRGRNHLSGSRYLRRVDSPQLGEREREAVKKLAARFRPEWDPPKERYSDWHYLVLSKSEEDSRYHYHSPVVILMDTDCFSATDIFLSSFKGWHNVTLMGQPSSGGSARSEIFRLPNSGISIRSASMASFQPDGRLYDGNGIFPDIVLEQPPEHFLANGPDADFEAAKKQILDSVASE